MRGRMGDAGMAELNTAQFDGKLASAPGVVGAGWAMPFLADKRLVIVEGMLTWLTRKGGGKTAKADLDYLVAALPTLPDSARLVFIEPETLNDSHPVLKLIRQEPRGYVKAFNPPGNPANWITKQVESYGGKIEPRAAAALAPVIGTDLRAADSECAKLVTYTGGMPALTRGCVGFLPPYSARATISAIEAALR